MKLHSAITCFLALCLSAQPMRAAPSEPIGSALVIVNLVTAAYNRDTRTLQQGDRVHQDELIEVGTDGSSEFKLDDDTKLALGPGSHLRLDKFVYDPAKSNGSIVLNLVKGAFRFMTGVAEKPTYLIKTPAAAITVRGTGNACQHEASVSQISEEQIFYMMSRGLTEAQAMSLSVNGFVNDLVRQFPMEYSVELKRLIDLEMEGSVG